LATSTAIPCSNSFSRCRAHFSGDLQACGGPPSFPRVGWSRQSRGAFQLGPRLCCFLCDSPLIIGRNFLRCFCWPDSQLCMCHQSHRTVGRPRYISTLFAWIKRAAAMMDTDVFGQAEADERILTFDIPDEALDRAAASYQKAVTWIYCTNGWHSCDWPQ
jgi:hypothetical protein